MAKYTNLDILKHTHMTEKAIRDIETKNELIFITEIDIAKEDIKKAVESEFAVKVERINLCIDQKGRKKAFVKLKKEFPAMDIATKLGIM